MTTDYADKTDKIAKNFRFLSTFRSFFSESSVYSVVGKLMVINGHLCSAFSAHSVVLHFQPIPLFFYFRIISTFRSFKVIVSNGHPLLKLPIFEYCLLSEYAVLLHSQVNKQAKGYQLFFN